MPAPMLREVVPTRGETWLTPALGAVEATMLVVFAVVVGVSGSCLRWVGVGLAVVDE